jgi:Protein of unknown function, DUF481
MVGTRLTLSLALAWSIVGASTAYAAKTDIVELTNGDRITCEIKKLDRGKLTVKTDGLGTIAIEWDDIKTIASTARFDIELKDGRRTYGSLGSAAPRMVDVVDASQKERLALGDIVRLAPVGRTLWKKLDGSISAGFSFTEANQQTQWTFDSTMSYRSRYWLTELSADSLLTSQQDADSQTRNTLTLQSARFLHPRWSALGFLEFQQNEELSLDLRSLVGMGFSRTLASSNRTLASIVGGAAFTHEQYAGESGQDVAEAVAGASWEFFTFDGRATNLSTSAMTYYALNFDGRVRAELNASFKSDIVGDLYWSINTFESYNSRPPAGQKSNDFGVSATMGWTF